VYEPTGGLTRRFTQAANPRFHSNSYWLQYSPRGRTPRRRTGNRASARALCCYRFSFAPHPRLSKRRRTKVSAAFPLREVSNSGSRRNRLTKFGDKDSSLLETALTLPLPIVMLLFVVDVGYFFLVAAYILTGRARRGNVFDPGIFIFIYWLPN
jgi:hypothetical protein